MEHSWLVSRLMKPSRGGQEKVTKSNKKKAREANGHE
jgi:hypothetical protein